MIAYEISVGDNTFRIELERTAERERSQSAADWKLRINGSELSVSALRLDRESLSFILNGHSFDARVSRNSQGLSIFLDGVPYECVVRDPRSFQNRRRAAGGEAGEQKIAASMPGKVVRVLARAGENVAVGQGILVIEAMKMQNEVRASKSGTLKKLMIQEGSNVNAGEVLAIIE